MTDKTWKPCGPCPTNCDYVLDVSSLPLTRPQSLAEVFISTYLSVLVKTIFLTYFLQNYWGAGYLGRLQSESHLFYLFLILFYIIPWDLSESCIIL